jgi:predicted alpha-1,2-mannosidase
LIRTSHISFSRIFIASMIAVAFVFSEAQAQRSLAKLVNPFVGTAKNGHTYPGASLPFGMVQLSPDTRVEGWDACSGYHYSDSTILGFSHTHLSGTGVADYGDILVLPTIGAMGARSISPARFIHSEESASPGFYRVRLLDADINVELTATKRVGVHRYTFPKTDSAVVLVDLKHGLGLDKVIESSLQIVGDREIAGYRRSDGWAKNQIVYFVAQFSKPFRSSGISVDSKFEAKRKKASGTDLRGYVRFATGARESIILKIALSSVSIAGARRNLAAEMPGWEFDVVKSVAERIWNEELNRIWVDGGSQNQHRTFYTALYHAMLTPNVFSDVDGQYRGMDGTTRKTDGFEMYTVFSLWDTFRAEHPLFTIIDRKRAMDFVRSILSKYEESGLLPVWELASNETFCMIGYHSVPVIVDAWVKGLRNFNAERALAAMQHSAELDHFGLKSYRQSGYIASESESESVSKTLEYAYDDWCIAQFAEALGKKQIVSEFSERAQFFQNLFDPSSGFMRARENGRWYEPFDPSAVTFNYTEANAWQYSFFVPHDIPGLIRLYGGKGNFVRKLDELFNADIRTSGRNQLDISGMVGQYAQGNEPSHHVAYLYDDAGAPWKTQKLIRRIVDSLFTPEPDGLCGNDDCGQMSAWYVFSAMGFYPVTPGTPFYSIGSPLFDRVTLRLDHGRQFVISTTGNGAVNPFIQSGTLNGSSSTRTFISHDEIMNGGVLNFQMGPLPNQNWGVGPGDATPAPPEVGIVTAPVIQAASTVFADSLVISIASLTPGASVSFAMMSGSTVGGFTKYERPLTINASQVIVAYAEKSGLRASRTVRAVFSKFSPPGTIKLNSRYSPQYTGGGDEALIDGRRGNTDFRLGAWQGYEGTDLDAIIDLGGVRQVSRVQVGCLQDNNSWIFFPRSVEFSFSSDGVTFGPPTVLTNTVSEKDEAIQIKEFSADVASVNARYLRVHARSVGRCPEWHKGAGNKAWLFADEITVLTR